MCSLSLVFGMVMIAIFWYKPLTEALDDVTIGSADACEAIKSVSFDSVDWFSGESYF